MRRAQTPELSPILKTASQEHCYTAAQTANTAKLQQNMRVDIWLEVIFGAPLVARL